MKRNRNNKGKFIKTYNISKDFLTKEYLTKNRSTYDIAKEISCSSVHILNLLRKFKILIKNKRARYKIVSQKLSDSWENGEREGVSEKISKTITNKWNLDKQYRRNHKKVYDKVYRDKVSKQTKKRWENIDYKNKVLSKTISKGNNRPNLSEIKLLKILNKLFFGDYRYVGDGSLMIEGFNPDFINCNGQKKIIELYGDYWHNLPNYIERDKRRIVIYKKYGYETLVIWGHELKNIDKVKNKVMEFNSA